MGTWWIHHLPPALDNKINNGVYNSWLAAELTQCCLATFLLLHFILLQIGELLYCQNWCKFSETCKIQFTSFCSWHSHRLLGTIYKSNWQLSMCQVSIGYLKEFKIHGGWDAKPYLVTSSFSDSRTLCHCVLMAAFVDDTSTNCWQSTQNSHSLDTGGA